MLPTLRSALWRGRTLPPVPQVSDIDRSTTPAGLVLEKLAYRTEPGAQGNVPLLVMSPARREERDGGDPTTAAGAAAAASSSGRHPAVVMLHGTGGNKEEMLPLMQSYSSCGYLTAAIDSRYHGGRAVREGQADERTCYQQALIRSWRGESDERPFLFDTVFDLLALLDYLCSRPDVDPTRIGMTGISLGGMHTWVTACLDERVAVACPMLGIQGWRWALEHEQWHGRVESVPLLFEAASRDLGEAEVTTPVVRRVVDTLLPGLLEEWDTPFSLPLLAPRAVLIANGELDPRCPMAGVHEALKPAAAAYAAAGAADKLQLYVEAGVGHQRTAGMDAAIRRWFDQHLQGPGS